jgi:hypothetical protein
MNPSGRRVGLNGLRQAFDEVRFGAPRTLNLRESLPTAAAAATRADTWLRQKQVERAGEVLIITGRGNQSEGGHSVVREAVIRLMHTLKRRGVVADHQEHTQGSFVVTLAPVSAFAASANRGAPALPPLPPSPPSLDNLDAETRTLLRNLAERSLEGVGVQDTSPFLEGEMLKQFGAIAAKIVDGPGREARLREAVRVAMDQHE